MPPTHHATTASNAGSTGGYLLREHAWDTEWIAHQGFPLDLLPELCAADDADLGRTDAGTLGIGVPLAASMGDQHAALLALGGLEAGLGMCRAGHRSLRRRDDRHRPRTAPARDRRSAGPAGLAAGRPHPLQPGGVHLRDRLGAALALRRPGTVRDPAADRRAGGHGRAAAPDGPRFFFPALAGVRVPVWRPAATGALTGLSLATTRADIARAVLEGIAHSVCDLVEGVAATMGAPLRRLRCGGGVAGSDHLLQTLADLVGMELERVAEPATASLRGSAYLAGVGAGLWSSLEEVVEARPSGRVFTPRTTPTPAARGSSAPPGGS